MSAEQQQLEAALVALEAQRAALGELAVETMRAALQARLAALTASAAPPAAPAQTLKQVSILFLDVVGSTTLSQRLDPEAISTVMDDALARATAVVREHRGKVLQYAGDNLLAAFGADGASEDDAERAVHCGLALLELGRLLGSEVQARHGHAGFDVRVGIHTGGVLLGGGVDAEGTIRGIAVNIAARMEQTAPAGALRISHDTFDQVRGMFDVDAQAPLAIKGLDAPMTSYLVRHARPRQYRIRARGIEGVATRMIGRDAELAQLQAAFGRLFEQRRLAAVTVVADAGVGKSRLLHEFEALSETRPERFLRLRGRATPSTGTQAYGLLRDIIARRFQIADDDSVEAARKKMEDGIVPLFVHDDGADLAEAHAHLLGHLIGIEWRDSRHLRGILDDPRQIRNRAFHAAAQLFRRIAAGDGSPVLLQVEDLHWADGESLDFLDHLAEVDRDVPLLVLAFTRPTLFERGAGWRIDDGVHQRIDLHPLGKDLSRLLADELLQKLPRIPAALRELLTSSAEGNPFYMEELVRMLIDQGAIETGGPQRPWKVDADRLLVTHVPPTLTGVLQTRLDGLPAPEKRALQQASVVGAVFWDHALAAIEAEATGQLPALVRRELTLPRADAALEGLREYAFRHQVLHQVTYDTVLKRHKRDGHARVAQWLANLTAQGGLRSGDLLGLAAEHFEQAEDGPNAAEFHARAAEHAGQRFAHDRVLAHVGRALVQLGEPGPALQRAEAELRWRLLGVREATLFLQARRDEQTADLDALDRLADVLDDDRRRADVARRRCNRAARMADWAAQALAARHGMACAERAGDDDLRLRLLNGLASARVLQGDVADGRAIALRGLGEARRLALRGVEGKLLSTLAMVAGQQGDAPGAHDLTRQTVQINRETGDRVNEAIGLSNLGMGWLRLGDTAQARSELEAALQLVRAHGDRAIEAAALGHLSALALWQGHAAKASALARQALDLAHASKARSTAVTAALRLGDAEAALGRRAEARQAYAQAHALAGKIGDPSLHDAAAGLARVALADGDGAAAQAVLQPLLDDADAGSTSVESSGEPRLIELTCHRVLACTGAPRAEAWLQRAHTALMAQADAIERWGGAALRQAFLQNIPWHREILAAWGRFPAAHRERDSR